MPKTEQGIHGLYRLEMHRPLRLHLPIVGLWVLERAQAMPDKELLTLHGGSQEQIVVEGTD